MKEDVRKCIIYIYIFVLKLTCNKLHIKVICKNIYRIWF